MISSLSSSMSDEPRPLLQQAKQGGTLEQGQLFASYTNYLKIIAESQLDRRVRRRVSPSDLVQETLLEAHRDFGAFRGKTDAEFFLWLRQILVHNLMRASEKHLQTDKRDVRREVYVQALHASIEKSNARLEHVLADRIGSPSSEAGRLEQMRLVSNAIADLPAEQRQVIVLRHVEGLQFAEIAEQMERSSGACRMLWLRGMDQLRERLDGVELE